MNSAERTSKMLFYVAKKDSELPAVLAVTIEVILVHNFQYYGKPIECSNRLET